MGKSNYHERKEARIERYEKLAEESKKESENAYRASNEAVEGIPPGQPILVGHHSEGNHRRALKKSWDKMDQSISLNNKSEYYSEKAQAAEHNTAISSDDPDALLKLNEKLESLIKKQDFMKMVNRICRNKKLSVEEIHQRLKMDYELSDTSIYGLLNPKYSYEKKGFQSYSLTNNNAKIKQVKNRIKRIEALEKMESKDYHFEKVKVSVNVEDNRVEIYFPTKPDENFRRRIKSNGFRWSPDKGAWQKQISRWNIMDAQKLAKEFSEL